MNDTEETGGKEQQKSRRGMPIYKENPFIKDALVATKQGTKRITNKTNDRMMIVSDQGEIIAPAGFHQVVEVDKTQFVKLYINGVKAFQGLSNPGTRVFEILYRMVQSTIGKDTIFVHYNEVDQSITPISRATFDRGMKELLEKKFIASTASPGVFYLNIDYMFNGNRLAFIKEYRLTSNDEKRAKASDIERLEAAGQTRLCD